MNSSTDELFKLGSATEMAGEEWLNIALAGEIGAGSAASHAVHKGYRAAGRHGGFETLKVTDVFAADKDVDETANFACLPANVKAKTGVTAVEGIQYLAHCTRLRWHKLCATGSMRQQYGDLYCYGGLGEAFAFVEHSVCPAAGMRHLAMSDRSYYTSFERWAETALAGDRATEMRLSGLVSR